MPNPRRLGAYVALVAVLASRGREAHPQNGVATAWSRSAREDALR